MSKNDRDVQGLDRADFDWDDEDSRWTCSVDVGSFMDLLEPVAVLRNDALIKVDGTTMSIEMTGAAQVTAVRASVDCLNAPEDSFEFGVDIDELTETVPRVEADTIDVSVGPEEVTLTGMWAEKVTTVRPENVLGEDPPDLDGFEHTATAPAVKARGAIGAMAEYARLTDGYVVEIVPEEDWLHVGVLDDEYELVESWGFEADVEPGEGAIYSPQYLNNVANSVWARGEMRIEFSPEYPLKIDYPDEDDSLEVVLAPYIGRPGPNRGGYHDHR